ncbi:unnamed protein product, partial [marine sediment metagenome]
RLFNEKEGQKYLKEMGIAEEVIEKLPLLGISSIANLLMSIKFAKYFELTKNDVIMTVYTDSMELYQSRLQELNQKNGPYTRDDSICDFYAHLQSQKIDNMLELDYMEKKRIHNLKYFTWIEQQNRELDELNNQWYDEDYWRTIPRLSKDIDELIVEFNEKTGILK